MNERHLVLWDGECGFCRRCVTWLQRTSAADRLECVPYQQAAATLPDDLAAACERAVHVVSRDGDVLRAGRAILFIAGEIGWQRSSRVLARAPFIWIVDWLYAVVARHRSIFSRLLSLRAPRE